jgi:hypothetical protein
MNKDSSTTDKSPSQSSSTTVTTTHSGLPGLEGVEVIISKPSLVKENSSKITKK